MMITTTTTNKIMKTAITMITPTERPPAVPENKQ
jgi:hypothetical protein